MKISKPHTIELHELQVSLNNANQNFRVPVYGTTIPIVKRIGNIRRHAAKYTHNAIRSTFYSPRKTLNAKHLTLYAQRHAQSSELRAKGVETWNAVRYVLYAS